MLIRNILIKYWGYSAFRPMQQEIIESVMLRKDTLALLPTGGGKSVCFQVPALSMDGVCIVVTPLIALMKDQVVNLKKKGVKAFAIYSGMRLSEVEVAYNACVFGDAKFLYVSPERLSTPAFLENLKRMKVNLLAIDEAHCISQWGYDFRPAYLKIAEVRSFIPKVPVLALTATATGKVIDDIQEKLNFRQKNVLQRSFERKNLTYVVLKEENKLVKLLYILNHSKGSAIVYVRNRRKTKEISNYLNQHKIRSGYYHAGLDSDVREKMQDDWTKGSLPVIVATNAFGMGIDKPDVRAVVHMDLPDNLESYFQEAGRAGRDEKNAFAFILYEDSDVLDLRKRFSISYPKLSEIKNVYNAIGNYFQLAVGSGKDQSFDFDMADFSQKFKFSNLLTFNALRFLEKEGYLFLNEGIKSPSRLLMRMNREDLYRFQVENPFYDHFVKILLRSYSGLFTEYTSINESEIAKRTDLETEAVKSYLARLHKLQVLDYIPKKSKPQLIYGVERLDQASLHISKETYQLRKKSAKQRLQSVIDYVQDSRCRNQLLLAYFGEKDVKRCGKCDVCRERNKLDVNELEFENINQKLRPLLMIRPYFLQEVIEKLEEFPEDQVVRVIRWLQDIEKIKTTEDNRLTWDTQQRLKL